MRSEMAIINNSVAHQSVRQAYGGADGSGTWGLVCQRWLRSCCESKAEVLAKAALQCKPGKRVSCKTKAMPGQSDLMVANRCDPITDAGYARDAS